MTFEDGKEDTGVFIKYATELSGSGPDEGNRNTRELPSMQPASRNEIFLQAICFISPSPSQQGQHTSNTQPNAFRDPSPSTLTVVL